MLNLNVHKNTPVEIVFVNSVSANIDLICTNEIILMANQ